jgi:hypothetical protein
MLYTTSTVPTKLSGLKALSNVRADGDDTEEACLDYANALVDVIKSGGDMENVIAMLMQLSIAINGTADNGISGKEGQDCSIDGLLDLGEAANALADKIMSIEENISGNLDTAIDILDDLVNLTCSHDVTLKVAMTDTSDGIEHIGVSLDGAAYVFTDADGNVTFNKLIRGDYVITIDPSEGFVADETPLILHISDDGEITLNDEDDLTVHVHGA